MVKVEPNEDLVGDVEVPRTRVKTEKESPNEEVSAFDDPIDYNHQTIKRESPSDGQTDDDEVPRKRMKTENRASDEVRAFDDPINGSQPTVKREPALDGQSSDDVNTAVYDTLSSDNESDDESDESDQEDELSAQSNSASANLKLVYDVEYQPPS